MEDRCIMCGDIIPEGRMVCPNCESNIMQKTKDKSSVKNKNTTHIGLGDTTPFLYNELKSFFKEYNFKNFINNRIIM